jgi:hypothetical protein
MKNKIIWLKIYFHKSNYIYWVIEHLLKQYILILIRFIIHSYRGWEEKSSYDNMQGRISGPASLTQYFFCLEKKKRKK